MLAHTSKNVLSLAWVPLDGETCIILLRYVTACACCLNVAATALNPLPTYFRSLVLAWTRTQEQNLMLPLSAKKLTKLACCGAASAAPATTVFSETVAFGIPKMDDFRVRVRSSQHPSAPNKRTRVATTH